MDYYKGNPDILLPERKRKFKAVTAGKGGEQVTKNLMLDALKLYQLEEIL